MICGRPIENTETYKKLTRRLLQTVNIIKQIIMFYCYLYFLKLYSYKLWQNCINSSNEIRKSVLVNITKAQQDSAGHIC